MTDHTGMKPGDLLEYRCPRTSIVWQWRVISICIGAAYSESLIELAPVMLKPGRTQSGSHLTNWVPEPMTRSLTLVNRDD